MIEKLTPAFERALSDDGLVLLNWGHGGWAHFFTAERVETLDELKATKLFTSAGDERMLQWYKESGFDPEPLAITDVMLGLNTGLINAYPSPPYAALLLGWYDKVSYMMGCAADAGAWHYRRHRAKLEPHQRRRPAGDEGRGEADGGCPAQTGTRGGTLVNRADGDARIDRRPGSTTPPRPRSAHWPTNSPPPGEAPSCRPRSSTWPCVSVTPSAPPGDRPRDFRQWP